MTSAAGPLERDPQRPQLAIGAAADVAAVGDRLADVGRASRRSAARPAARSGSRAGRRRATRRRPGRRRPRSGTTSCGPRNASRGVIASSPQGGGGASFACGGPGSASSSPTAARSAATSRSPLVAAGSPRPKIADDDVLGVELEVDPVRVEDLLGQPVAGRAGAAHVDREPQRVPAGDPGATDHRLVEHGEAGNRGRSARGCGRSPPASRRAARPRAPPPADAPRRASRSAGRSGWSFRPG